MNAEGQTLTFPLVAEVGAIDNDLGNTFAQLNTAAANNETTILQDWGKMSFIGPRTLIDGYNGLGLTPDEQNTAVDAATKAYGLSILTDLMSAEFQMQVVPAGDVGSTLFVDDYSNIPYWWSYPTFGSAQPANDTMGYFWNTKSNESPSQAAFNDLNNYGANSFEFINGINMWNGESFAYQSYPTGTNPAIVVTIYNASPVPLSVQAERANIRLITSVASTHLGMGLATAALRTLAALTSNYDPMDI